MTYRELKQRQQEEINAFPFIWAFNENQFAEGMRRLGLDPTADREQIVHYAGGGYIRKSDKEALEDLFKKHRRELLDAIEGDQTGDGFIFDMFSTELANHEYSYTMDLSEAIAACGLTVEQINANPALIHGLKRAADEQRDE